MTGECIVCRNPLELLLDESLTMFAAKCPNCGYATYVSKEKIMPAKPHTVTVDIQITVSTSSMVVESIIDKLAIMPYPELLQMLREGIVGIKAVG